MLLPLRQLIRAVNNVKKIDKITNKGFYKSYKFHPWISLYPTYVSELGGESIRVENTIVNDSV